MSNFPTGRAAANQGRNRTRSGRRFVLEMLRRVGQPADDFTGFRQEGLATDPTPNETVRLCYKLIEPVAKFLGRARAAAMFVVYTAVDRYRNTPEARMPQAFKQQSGEPVISPPAFDKFYGDELQPMLQQRGIKTVIACGASSNQAVLYTATAAVRPFGYDAVIPVDGLIVRGEYEHEFTLHQFTILPGVLRRSSGLPSSTKSISDKTNGGWQ